MNYQLLGSILQIFKFVVRETTSRYQDVSEMFVELWMQVYTHNPLRICVQTLSIYLSDIDKPARLFSFESLPTPVDILESCSTFFNNDSLLPLFLQILDFSRMHHTYQVNLSKVFPFKLGFFRFRAILNGYRDGYICCSNPYWNFSRLRS